MSGKTNVTIDRVDAEHRYADLIIKHGNPLYFIFKYLQDVESHELEEMLEEMNDQAAGGNGGETFSVIDEE
jgi:hypothetical protein